MRTVCPGTPEHNGVAEKFNQTLQKKIRSLLLDSGLPANMWDVALGVATYLYNISPHKTLNMKSPIQVLSPKFNIDINQLKRFGCLTYAKIKNEGKFKDVAIKTYLVGYLPTGYVLYHPESKKLIETREVRFVERYVYKDINKQEVDQLNISRTDPENKNQQTEEVIEQIECSEFEGEQPEPAVKRKRGRPKKETKPNALIASVNGDTDLSCDTNIQALIANIMGDPKNYKEAMARPDWREWLEPINVELEALELNQVYVQVRRPIVDSQGRKPNILDARWILKTKLDSQGEKL